MNFLLIVNNSIVKENVRKKRCSQEGRYVLSSKNGDKRFYENVIKLRWLSSADH